MRRKPFVGIVLLIIAAFLAMAGCAGVSREEASMTFAAPDGSDEARVLTIANDYRRVLGLPPFSLHRQLSSAAQAHAAYLSGLNAKQRDAAVSAHRETKGVEGYTGETLGDRAEFFGYSGAVAEGVARGDFLPEHAIIALFDAPYHRLEFVNPNYTDIGFGIRGDARVTVINYGSKQPLANETVVVYPYPGQRDVGTSWHVRETPNPLATFGIDDAIVGYPISVSVGSSRVRELRFIAASLRLDGREIPFFAVHAGNDRESKGNIFLIPQKPLQPGGTYEVTVEADKVYGDEKAERFRQIWRFTTQRDLEIKHAILDNYEGVDFVLFEPAVNSIPDLEYTLDKDGRRVRTKSAFKKSITYRLDAAVLPEGDYRLHVASRMLGQEKDYRLRLATINGKRAVFLE